MINTVDFITPPVDDPYWFGQISAANSISDVYSMGGKPLTALNLVMFPAKKLSLNKLKQACKILMFPSKQLDMGILKDILQGGHDKVVEAGACLVGGHSVDDEEPKYGLCVNGVVHPERIITNAGARPGDALILTKPLGSGVLFNAVRAGKYPFEELEKETLPLLAALNDKAIEAALEFDLHACTDITGFGILGHVLEVALGSKARVRLHHKELIFYPGAAEMYQQGQSTGSNRPNRELVAQHDLQLEISLTPAEEELLYDPQTSGGLLLALPKEQAPDLLKALAENGVQHAACIGEVVDQSAGVTLA